MVCASYYRCKSNFLQNVPWSTTQTQISNCFLFHIVADEGEMLSSYKAVSSEVKQLLEDGLEDKTLANLKDRLAAVQPQHLVRSLFPFRLITILKLHVIL